VVNPAITPEVYPAITPWGIPASLLPSVVYPPPYCQCGIPGHIPPWGIPGHIPPWGIPGYVHLLVYRAMYTSWYTGLYTPCTPLGIPPSHPVHTVYRTMVYTTLSVRVEKPWAQGR